MGRGLSGTSQHCERRRLTEIRYGPPLLWVRSQARNIILITKKGSNVQSQGTLVILKFSLSVSPLAVQDVVQVRKIRDNKNPGIFHGPFRSCTAGESRQTCEDAGPRIEIPCCSLKYQGQKSVHSSELRYPVAQLAEIRNTTRSFK